MDSTMWVNNVTVNPSTDKHCIINIHAFILVIHWGVVDYKPISKTVLVALVLTFEKDETNH